jgi:hypothetical protein
MNLYTPDMLDAAMMSIPNSGTPGMGMDLLEHARGEAGYSPLCHVITYNPTLVTGTPMKASDIPMTAQDPDPMTGPVYLYCLAVQP